MLSQIQIIILLRSHLGLLLRCMVVISDKMEKAMDHNPEEFLLKGSGSISDGIFAYGIHAHENVAGQKFSFAIVESNDIGEIVMGKIFLIDIEDVIVGTKYYVNLSETSHFAFGYSLEPQVVHLASLENERCILEKIS